MTDRTAPGEPRAQGKARLGEAGEAEWVSTLRREDGCRQGEVQQPGGEPARHWPPEPVAKVGLAGDDGAVIGASALGLEMRPGLQKGGCASQPEGQDAGATDTLRGSDMVRCDGEARGTAVWPS